MDPIGSCTGRIWIEVVPVQSSSGRLQAFEGQAGIDWARYGSDMDPFEPGTDRICFELSPLHSSSGRMQTFRDPNWIRVSQVRMDSMPSGLYFGGSGSVQVRVEDAWRGSRLSLARA